MAFARKMGLPMLPRPITSAKVRATVARRNRDMTVSPLRRILHAIGRSILFLLKNAEACRKGAALPTKPMTTLRPLALRLDIPVARMPLQ